MEKHNLQTPPTCEIIAVMGTKGGVAKTTTTANLAGLLAALGKRVLMVDLDYQPTLSNYYQFQREAPAGASSLILSPNEAFLPDSAGFCVSSTDLPNLSLIYSDIAMRDAQITASLAHNHAKLVCLRNVLRGNSPSAEYLTANFDVVLLDTHGGVTLLGDMACLAAHRVLLPVQPDSLSAREAIAGTEALYVRASALSALNPTLTPGVPAYFFQSVSETNNDKEHVESLTQHLYGKGQTLLATSVPDRVAYKSGAARRVPVHTLDASASDVMHALVRELWPDLKEQAKDAKRPAMKRVA